ncbi:Serine/threonine-protein phosphatase T (PPT), partial [Durusdinium trenchii]
MTFLLRSQPSDQPSDLVASFCPWFWLVAGRMVGELEPRLVNLRTGGLPGLTGLGRIPTDFFLKQSLKNAQLTLLLPLARLASPGTAGLVGGGLLGRGYVRRPVYHTADRSLKGAQRVLGSSTWTVRVSASALLRRRRCSRVAVAVRASKFAGTYCGIASWIWWGFQEFSWFPPFVVDPNKKVPEHGGMKLLGLPGKRLMAADWMALAIAREAVRSARTERAPEERLPRTTMSPVGPRRDGRPMPRPRAPVYGVFRDVRSWALPHRSSFFQRTLAMWAPGWSSLGVTRTCQVLLPQDKAVLRRLLQGLEAKSESDALRFSSKQRKAFEALRGTERPGSKQAVPRPVPTPWSTLLSHITAGTMTWEDAHSVFQSCSNGENPLPCSLLLALVRAGKELVRWEPMLLRLSVPAGRLVILGDTHGHLKDVVHIWKTEGLPSKDLVYLFNGDICDRGDSERRGGQRALQIWASVLAYKIAAPECIYVTRGNHEDRDYWPQYGATGFSGEIEAKYDRSEADDLLDAFGELCDQLPLAAVVQEQCLVLHGGLPRCWADDPSRSLQ